MHFPSVHTVIPFGEGLKIRGEAIGLQQESPSQTLKRAGVLPGAGWEWGLIAGREEGHNSAPDYQHPAGIRVQDNQTSDVSREKSIFSCKIS